jgi:hypothetical protein
LFLDFGSSRDRPGACDVRWRAAIGDHTKGGFYGPDGRPMFSPLHEGFAIYLARQLKPIWRLKVTQPA